MFKAFLFCVFNERKIHFHFQKSLRVLRFGLPSHGIGEEEDNLRHNNVATKCSQNFLKQTNGGL